MEIWTDGTKNLWATYSGLKLSALEQDFLLFKCYFILQVKPNLEAFILNLLTMRCFEKQELFFNHLPRIPACTMGYGGQLGATMIILLQFLGRA